MDTQVIDNRNLNRNAEATAEDAQTLGRIYHRLQKASKNLKSASSAVKQSWSKGLQAVAEARAERDKAQQAFDAIADDAWTALNMLPKGTTASGGATPQTVALEFYSSNLNRELKSRLTPSEARKINSRSFA